MSTRDQDIGKENLGMTVVLTHVYVKMRPRASIVAKINALSIQPYPKNVDLYLTSQILAV